MRRPAHTPAGRLSVGLQRWPPLPGVPSGRGAGPQRSAASLQTPPLHGSPAALQSRGVPPHTPAVQASLTVQKAPSSQAVPSAFAGLVHVPVRALHVPAAWHWSEGAQTTGSVPRQTPASHTSLRVQALASLHGLPSSLGGFVQVPVAGSQAPATCHSSA